ncbi:DUF2515 family protein [Alicyclobacillus fastidiosus]|uniref:DUF2515 family protein n=1 Tax=Alicyclobacillus fastidiosus TaxID=392011 RepID=UPI0023E9C9DA|nr:DUF2515 family protein [Alicyclobacillus fastidiosus]GMA64685.1 hypothetical protein GCM10025859_51250 [Alicyclobacillus fastidiosus]
MMLQSLMNRAKLLWLMTAGRDRKKVLHLVSTLAKSAKDEELVAMSVADRAVVEEILETTGEHNRNNLTRTAAYLRFYRARPEVHWAFLAHMVSRNGGFSMTDVKGEWFSRIAATAQHTRFFEFLERANWLIFGDAYPQLLLYEKCESLGRDLTHLLPALGVSRFMRPIWKTFLQTKDSSLLTHALIINEQNFIQSRVIESPNYDDEVIFTLEFQTQAVLGLNQVLFPYRDRVTSAPDSPEPLCRSLRRSTPALKRGRSFTAFSFAIRPSTEPFSTLHRVPNTPARAPTTGLTYSLVTAAAVRSPSTTVHAFYNPQNLGDASTARAYAMSGETSNTPPLSGGLVCRHEFDCSSIHAGRHGT